MTFKKSASFEDVEMKPFSSTELTDPSITRFPAQPTIDVTMKVPEPRQRVAVTAIRCTDSGLRVTVHNMGRSPVRFDLTLS